jgi:ABC-type uncharacterized transport system substrate-binding protein
MTAAAVLRNPNNANAEAQTSSLQAAARKMGIELHFVTATNEQEIDAPLQRSLKCARVR